MSDDRNRRSENQNHSGSRFSENTTPRWTEADFAAFTGGVRRPRSSANSDNSSKRSSKKKTQSNSKKVPQKTSRNNERNAQSRQAVPYEVPASNSRQSRSYDDRLNRSSAVSNNMSRTRENTRSATRSSVRSSGRGRGTPPKKQFKLSKNARRILLILSLLALIMITALLCIFLVFKVEKIIVTGDKVYEDGQIISIANFEKGDNLFFVSTVDKEELLREKLPYIKKAEIKRKIPNTLEIKITGTKLVGSIQTEQGYIYIDEENKIVEIAPEPRQGIMTIVGLAVVNPTVGQQLKIENDDANEAYEIISKQIVDSEAEAEFTKLDMTNIHDIRLYYQDRVEMLLGNVNALAYKIEFGINIVRSKSDIIQPTDRGTLDLSLLHENRKAPFSKDYSQLPPETGTDGEAGEGEGAQGALPAFASNSGRGSDIPDYPYGYEPPSGDSDDNTGGDSDSDDYDGEDAGGDSDSGDDDDDYDDDYDNNYDINYDNDDDSDE